MLPSISFRGLQVKKEVEAERERRVSDKGDSEDAKARAATYDKLVLVQEQLLSTICQMKVLPDMAITLNIYVISFYGNVEFFACMLFHYF